MLFMLYSFLSKCPIVSEKQTVDILIHNLYGYLIIAIIAVTDCSK